MDKSEQALILREQASQQLAQIKSIESGKEYLSKVKGIEAWAKAEKQDAQMQALIAEQKLRTQRILGQLIKQGQEAGEIAVKADNHYSSSRKHRLVDLGITRDQSRTYQSIASIPEPAFNEFIETKKAEVNEKAAELTTAGMLRFKKQLDKEFMRAKQEEAGRQKQVNVDFRLGDFTEVLADIPDGSVDCIITDPPYPYEFIDCWSRLSEFAASKLKPNGFCIAYSGQANLNHVMRLMDHSLQYYWVMAVYHEGSTQIVNGSNFMCRWKPVLVYQNGKKRMPNVVQDYFISKQREKEGHDWQQSLSGVKYLIEHFTKTGDLIVEPFAGSGTTIKAAIEMNRSVIAAEIDETTYNIAKAGL
jgi:hypothetical protein